MSCNCEFFKDVLVKLRETFNVNENQRVEASHAAKLERSKAACNVDVNVSKDTRHLLHGNIDIDFSMHTR